VHVLKTYAFRENASSFEHYQRHSDQIKELNLAQLNDLSQQSGTGQFFPYKAENLTDFSVTQMGPELPAKSNVVHGDRGFFVKGDTYCDEYTAATTTSLPEDEQNE
jgi:hypothetical protein